MSFSCRPLGMACETQVGGGEAMLPGLGPAQFHFALSGTEYCRFSSVFADTTLAHTDQQSFLFLLRSHLETVAYPPSGVILLQDNTVGCSPWQGDVCLQQQPRGRFGPFITTVIETYFMVFI